MAKQRRSSTGNRKAKSKHPRAAEVVAFTEAEEAFFRAGHHVEQPTAAESFDDLDAGWSPRPSIWRRLLARAQAA